MKHALRAEGFGIRLRPVRMEDAAFIVWLRNQDYVKGNVSDSATDVRSQETWLKAYFEREGDYYFIVETLGGISVGTDSIYEMRGTSAEKGRQVARWEVTAAVPAGILATDLAFGVLRLTELRSTVVSTNLSVCSLHRRTGYTGVGVRRDALVIGGRHVDLVEFRLTAEAWCKVRSRLVPFAGLAERQIRQWDDMQMGQSQPWEIRLPAPSSGVGST
ncbi:MAG: GNAT family N-acetyltransferase [Bryobacteraceae bacterium]